MNGSLPRLPIVLGYPRTTERIALENWMSAYCRDAESGALKDRVKALDVGKRLSRRWLHTLPRP